MRERTRLVEFRHGCVVGIRRAHVVAGREGVASVEAAAGASGIVDELEDRGDVSEFVACAKRQTPPTGRQGASSNAPTMFFVPCAMFSTRMQTSFVAANARLMPFAIEAKASSFVH